LESKDQEIDDVRMGMGIKDLETEKRRLLENYYQRDMDVEKLRKSNDEFKEQIKQLNHKIEDMENITSHPKYQEAQDAISDLKSERMNLQKKIEELKADFDSHKEQFSLDDKKRLTGEVAFLKRQNSALQEKLSDLEKQAESVQGAVVSEENLTRFRQKSQRIYNSLADVISQWRNNVLLIQNYISDINKCFEAYSKVDKETLPEDAKRILRYIQPGETFESLNNILKIVVSDSGTVSDELKNFKMLIEA
jgi:chromosome segregation ATPase